MTGELYGLYIDHRQNIAGCAVSCRSRLTEIYESGVNYDGFCYPYFDSLLMSGHTEPYGVPFGTHTVLWVGDGRLADTEAESIGFDFRRLKAFLSSGLYEPAEDELLLGGFEYLAEGAVQPWTLRELSRKFCSFCEHIGRMEGVAVLGLTGGYAAVRLDNEELLETIGGIYNSKTGGVCRVLRSGAAEPEEI